MDTGKNTTPSDSNSLVRAWLGLPPLQSLPHGWYDPPPRRLVNSAPGDGGGSCRDLNIDTTTSPSGKRQRSWFRPLTAPAAALSVPWLRRHSLSPHWRHPYRVQPQRGTGIQSTTAAPSPHRERPPIAMYSLSSSAPADNFYTGTQETTTAVQPHIYATPFSISPLSLSEDRVLSVSRSSNSRSSGQFRQNELDCSNSPPGRSSTPDIRMRRRALLRLRPRLDFLLGPPPTTPARSMPAAVKSILSSFATGRFEAGCVPWTEEVAALLHEHCPEEFIPDHAKLLVPAADSAQALELTKLLLNIHVQTTTYCTRSAEEAAWSRLVEALLSVLPPSTATNTIIPRPLLTVLNATTKMTSTTLLPGYPTIKLDALLTFNYNHPSVSEITSLAVVNNLPLNAFSDFGIDDSIVLLGVKVMASAGDQAEAEYQLGIWGAKTLSLIRGLHGGGQPGDQEYVLGLAVSANIWNLYVMYWDENSLPFETVMVYGPVVVGGMESVYGLFKICAFVAQINVWAAGQLELWRVRVATALAAGAGAG